MDELPNELLIEIFAYLKFKDLCQLTLTCKRFNEIISNSSTLMDEFCLSNDDDINVDLMTKRKYRRIIIQTVNENLFKLLEHYGKNICEIKFFYNNFKSLEIKRILNFCSNFKQLKFFNQSFNNDWIEPLSKFSFQLLGFAKYFEKFYKFGSERNEKSIQIQLKSISKNFIHFLTNQKQLKTLQMCETNQYDELFKDDSLANVDFQLKTLFFELQFIEITNRDNFKKFLKNQQSLRKFIDSGCCHAFENDFAYANVLNDLKNIKELLVLNPFFENIPVQHIETLSIYHSYDEDFQDFKQLFPSVNNLIFQSSASRKHPKIKIPENVKTLTVNNVEFKTNSLFDDDVEINIENLTICRVDNIDWLISCFKNDRMKLKSLMIERTRMKKSQQEYLESLTRGEDKKIKKLKISMPMKLNKNNDCVWDYLMEDEFNDA